LIDVANGSCIGAAHGNAGLLGLNISDGAFQLRTEAGVGIGAVNASLAWISITGGTFDISVSSGTAIGAGAIAPSLVEEIAISSAVLSVSASNGTGIGWPPASSEQSTILKVFNASLRIESPNGAAIGGSSVGTAQLTDVSLQLTAREGVGFRRTPLGVDGTLRFECLTPGTFCFNTPSIVVSRTVITGSTNATAVSYGRFVKASEGATLDVAVGFEGAMLPGSLSGFPALGALRLAGFPEGRFQFDISNSRGSRGILVDIPRTRAFLATLPAPGDYRILMNYSSTEQSALCHDNNNEVFTIGQSEADFGVVQICSAPPVPDETLSTTAIALIVTGSVIVGAVVCAGFIYSYCRRRKYHLDDQSLRADPAEMYE
jgi:hypothetical protein